MHTAEDQHLLGLGVYSGASSDDDSDVAVGDDEDVQVVPPTGTSGKLPVAPASYTCRLVTHYIFYTGITEQPPPEASAILSADVYGIPYSSYSAGSKYRNKKVISQWRREQVLYGDGLAQETKKSLRIAMRLEELQEQLPAAAQAKDIAGETGTRGPACPAKAPSAIDIEPAAVKQRPNSHFDILRNYIPRQFINGHTFSKHFLPELKSRM